MDDVVELSLSRAIAVTNTHHIRAAVESRLGAGGLAVELVHFNVLVHCTSGSGLHMVDFEDVELSPGTALWIRPGQVQRWSETACDFDADVVVFESSMVPELPLFERLLTKTTGVNLNSYSILVAQQVATIAADLESTDDKSVAAAMLGVILRLLARNAGAGAVSDDPRQLLAAAFVDSVDADIEQRSVTWHAHRIGASTRSVARATIESFGQRPKEVIDSRVILEAQRRLAWSDDDIGTLGRSLAFSEASNFTKFFKARTGASPSEFRRSVTGDSQGVRN